jgi:hypothetical protein
MKPTDVPVKTDVGNQELAQRKHKLTPRARSLLIVIHGTETVAELSRNLNALGDIEDSLKQLASLGLIALRDRTATAGAVAAPAANAPDIVPPAQQVKQLLNESAVAVLGLRSFLFVLKLEHAYTAEDLRAIYPEYRRVVGKAKGEIFADAMLKRADAILARG